MLTASDFEKVGQRLAFRNDVVRQRHRTIARVDVGCAAQDRELGAHTRRIVEMRRCQEARSGELAREKRNAFRLGQESVIAAHLRPREEFPDHFLVNVAVLPQVERREMEAEYVG